MSGIGEWDKYYLDESMTLRGCRRNGSREHYQRALVWTDEQREQYHAAIMKQAGGWLVIDEVEPPQFDPARMDALREILHKHCQKVNAPERGVFPSGAHWIVNAQTDEQKADAAERVCTTPFRERPVAVEPVKERLFPVHFYIGGME